jgi:hypothetical protein
MHVISETSEVIIVTPHSSQVWLCYSGSHMNIMDCLLLLCYKAMRVKHDKLNPGHQKREILLFIQSLVHMLDHR